MAYVSAKKANAARIALEPLTCGVARSVVAIVPASRRLLAAREDAWDRDAIVRGFGACLDFG
jgi:hypothetical protein